MQRLTIFTWLFVYGPIILADFYIFGTTPWGFNLLV
jgi:hypothetical protein